MHVRLASVSAGRGLTRGYHVRLIRFLPSIVVLVGCAACGGSAPAPDVRLEWTLTPAAPTVGPALLRVRCLDADGRPLGGASLRVDGHMSHPGMAPVVVDAVEREAGTYEAALEFTMPGDWILLVSGTTAGGAPIRHRIDVANVRPAT